MGKARLGAAPSIPLTGSRSSKPASSNKSSPVVLILVRAPSAHLTRELLFVTRLPGTHRAMKPHVLPFGGGSHRRRAEPNRPERETTDRPEDGRRTGKTRQRKRSGRRRPRAAAHLHGVPSKLPRSSESEARSWASRSAAKSWACVRRELPTSLPRNSGPRRILVCLGGRAWLVRSPPSDNLLRTGPQSRRSNIYSGFSGSAFRGEVSWEGPTWT